MAKKYDESSVQTLDALAHIRMRPGMYIGRLGDGSHPDDGIYVLLKEVLDNSVDEFIMGVGNSIHISLDYATGMVKVRDFGRGIPLGKVIECVSQINTGAKYNDDVFQFSVGLNGVGTKAVNALSSHFLVRSFRDGEMVEARFCRGVLKEKSRAKSTEVTGTYIEFVPDSEIFKKFTYQEEFIQRRLRHYVYLNSGLKLQFNGEIFYSEQGLLDLLTQEVRDERLYEPLHFRSKMLEFAMVHTHNYGENYFSFVNGQYTADGGTHLSAFREGILKGVNEFAKKNFDGLDVRDGMFGVISVRVRSPVFESQTKNKLSNPDLRAAWVQEIKTSVTEMLYKNSDAATLLIERISFNEKLRKELSAVKKEAKERQKKISYKIPKLRDCKYHYTDGSKQGKQTMIFLTEGESAGASIVSARDPLTQAIYTLRGKPLNVYGMRQDQLYKNEELFNLMSALNLEEDISNLRYGKVVLATDADVDGMHIRNLLMTFFLTYFENLVIQGHLYILETPLYKVRNRGKTLYCYNQAERDVAMKELAGKGLEVTRFKGLGEISPDEFKQFVGKDIRLKPVTVHTFSDIKTTLSFYMGKNTPERRQFIMENLINEEAELKELSKLTEKP